MSRALYSLLLLLFVTSIASGQKVTPPSQSNPDWTRPCEPFRIAGNLYYVGTYDLACYLVTTSQGNMLINTGLAGSTPMIRANIEALGFKFSDLKILLTTQAHYDHVAAMADIKKLTGAKMMVNEGDAQVLADGGKSDFVMGGKTSAFAPVKADRLLHDGDTIRLGETALVALHHPGHTKGSTSFLVTVKDEQRSWKVLIANMPTILPQTRLMGMPAYPKVGEDYKYTLDAMKKLQFDIWMASHASQFNLHEKRKAGDGYNPAVFGDRALYDTQLDALTETYLNRLKTEK
jgi:metallo-beta-lactamase class B